MNQNERAIMLGIRHRCGQIVQFWIPAHIVSTTLPSLSDMEILGLPNWMRSEGLLEEEERKRPEDLVDQLETGLGKRDVALIDVEKDASICPSCGALLPWLDMLAEYAEGKDKN